MLLMEWKLVLDGILTELCSLLVNCNAALILYAVYHMKSKYHVKLDKWLTQVQMQMAPLFSRLFLEYDPHP